MRLAIDTGGTFTDCVFERGGRLQILKLPSTPESPARAIAEALRKIALSRGGGQEGALELLCGTTVGTNALLERRGGRVALITTAGFEDVLEIGRQARPKLYDFFVERPPPLVPRERRFGLRERIGDGGEVVLRPTRRELTRIVRAVERSGADSVAVCLLFSFANSAHEKRIAAALRRAGFRVSVSHEILPEIREFERTCATVINAYLVPVLSAYLEEVTRLLEKKPQSKKRAGKAGVRVMQSSGGIISARVTAREPVRTILSGPAGGVLGAEYVGKLAGFPRIISFDMGGTSTDVSLIDGRLQTTNESVVADLPISVPILDIHTVGAGGGSMARFDKAGALRVGPESAGANPGPICYGRGERATVTDAHLILGRLGRSSLLGGAFPLDEARARRYMQRACCDAPSKLSVEEFAAGILRVAEATMEKAMRVISIERGHDPRDYTLVAFGGAGGLHACALADSLGMPRAMMPRFPGGLSALGILRADVVKDFSRTILLPVENGRTAQTKLELAFRELERQGTRELKSEGFSAGQMRCERLLDMRYIGQAYELTVRGAGDFAAAFHREHQRRYGYADPARPIEVVNARVRLIGLTPKPRLQRIASAGRESRGAFAGKTRVFFGGRFSETPIYERERLRAANRLEGPAIIVEYSATTVMPPGWQGSVDAYGNLVLTRRT